MTVVLQLKSMATCISVSKRTTPAIDDAVPCSASCDWFANLIGRVTLSHDSVAGKTDRTAGVLDKMLEMQAQQVGRGGPREDEMEYDDAFLCDNVRI